MNSILCNAIPCERCALCKRVLSSLLCDVLCELVCQQVHDAKEVEIQEKVIVWQHKRAAVDAKLSPQSRRRAQKQYFKHICDDTKSLLRRHFPTPDELPRLITRIRFTEKDVTWFLALLQTVVKSAVLPAHKLQLVLNYLLQIQVLLIICTRIATQSYSLSVTMIPTGLPPDDQEWLKRKIDSLYYAWKSEARWNEIIRQKAHQTPLSSDS